MKVAGIAVEIERKKIKHTHLAVYPPDARVHVSAPEELDGRDIRSYVASKLAWIREQRRAILVQPRQTRREYVSGEDIWVLGRRHRLAVVEDGADADERVLRGGTKLSLRVRSGTGRARRERLVEGWQRALLEECIAGKMEAWCRKLGREVPSVAIRKMKTKWASCIRSKGKIVFNAALARVPPGCIEYVVVHELTHFEVADHSKAFVRLMDERLPRWRTLREELNGFVGMPMEETP